MIGVKSRKMRWARHVARITDMINAYKITVGKPEEMRHLGRPSCSWKNNMRMGLKEIGSGGGGMDWMLPARDMVQWRNSRTH
jgi:hypothetical protein